MPRGPRIKSESGIYHVMLRGINKLQLFYDDDDRQEFIGRLSRFKKACTCSLYAYCLMGNHVHLLINVQDGELSCVMRRLGISFASYYNSKYERSGFVFEGRFRSEPVDSEPYLLELVRYIHNNPVEIGESVRFWTSYSDYIEKPVLVDTDFVLGLFSSDRKEAQRLLAEFMCDTEDTATLSNEIEGRVRRRMSDSAAQELICSVAGVSHVCELADMDRAVRDKALGLLKAKGLSGRQLSRLTGINRGVVQRAPQ